MARPAARTLLVFLLFLFVLTSGGAAYAVQCTGSVSASFDAPTNTLTVTATPGVKSECTNAGVSVGVEGAPTKGAVCPTGDPCTLTLTWDTSCLAPGPHVISAYFICDYKLMQFYCYTGTPTTATTSYTQPEYVQNVGASVEQSSPTSIRVHMPYVFANSTGSRGLKLEHFLPNGQPDNFFWSSGAPTPAGEWTKDFDISCWLPGAHRFVVTATACDQWSRTAETATTVGPENPSISATVVTTGPNAARVDMPFSFPPTVNSRATALYHTKPDGSTDTVYWIGPSDQQSGSWSQPFDTTCWPTGTHTFLATATSCNRTTNSATATLEIVRKPHVDVAIVKGNGTKTAQISYQFPDNEPNGRSLSVEFLPVFPATGVTQLIVPMHPIPVSSGSISVDIPSFGTDGVLRVQASNSCGETDVKDTFIECDCHADEGDKTVGGPVRLWDGSMTYSERDPLPAGGMSLFSRNYDTNDLRDGVFGTGWRSAFDAGLSHFMDGSLDTVTIQMEGERKAVFVKS